MLRGAYQCLNRALQTSEASGQQYQTFKQCINSQLSCFGMFKRPKSFPGVEIIARGCPMSATIYVLGGMSKHWYAPRSVPLLYLTHTCS